MNPLYFESSTKVGLVNFPIRATLLPHKSGAILISPIEFDEAQVQILKQFTVTDIIAPSDIHHLFILDAHKLFPNARLWRSEGLGKKRPDVPWVLKLDFESLAIAHGSNVAQDGKRLLKGALSERGFKVQ